MAHIDAVSAVECGAQAREPQCTARDVGRDDLVGVEARAKGLDAASSAEVQHSTRRRGQLQGREGQRRPTHPEHMIGRQRALEGRFVEIARNPPLAGIGIRLAAPLLGPDQGGRHH